MTTDQFFAEFNNTYVDWDGWYGDQCWDLAAAYSTLVVTCPGLPTRPGGSGGAVDCYDYFLDPLPKFYDRIAYPTQMKKGDLVIWNNKVGGGYGHIAIFERYDSSGFVSFDQNWPVGSRSHFQKHDFVNVKGILRRKEAQMDPAADFDTANIYAQEMLFRNMPKDEWDKYHKGKSRNQLFDEFRAAGERKQKLAYWASLEQNAQYIPVSRQLYEKK